MKKLNIFIVDDHKLFREGLKLLLSMQDSINHIYEASNGREFLESLPLTNADVVLMDIEMPEMNGIEATKLALRRNSNLKIIVLSMYGDAQYYYKMIELGVRGFVLKSSGIEKVLVAINSVYNGDNYISEEILINLSKSTEVKENKLIDNKESDISEREMEILFYVSKGLTNEEIADKLFISKRTVDKHRANLLSKTGCRNTAALVMYAIKNNIIEL